MQNRYVADLGDFGKYGLLKYLGRGLRLGVIWYLVSDESHNSDGRHIRYLNLEPETAAHYGVRLVTKRDAAQNTPHFRACSPELYDALGGIVANRTRTVAEIRKRGLLPADTVFYEEALELSPGTPHERRRQRDAWVDAALARSVDCEIVFLDPDNGLEVPSCGPCSARGPKYVTYGEVRRFAARGQSVIIYQHFDMAPNLVNRRRQALAVHLGVDQVSIHVLHYHRGTARAYFVIPSAQHKELLEARVKEFLDTPWREHFSRA
jgi:hypothetical protein